MNLSRRSILKSLIAAPAVIAADRLMPIKPWLPTIYGDAVHDDWEGLTALVNNQRVNIKARIFDAIPGHPEFGMTSINNRYLLSKPLVFDRGDETMWRRDHFIGDYFMPTENFPKSATLIIDQSFGHTQWKGDGIYIERNNLKNLFSEK